MTSPHGSVPETTPTAAHGRPAGTLLLDVRNDDEWAAGHAPGAVHVPLDQLSGFPVPAARTVLCICRSGRRSAIAAEELRRAGHDAINVAGGMLAWADAGLPIVHGDSATGRSAD